MSSSQVAYHKGPQCDNCRSKWFYTENGLEFCRYCNAQQQGRIQVEADEDGYGQGGKVTKVKKDTVKKAPVAYQGRMAFEMYLYCYQLILWKQSYALMHEKGFPARFEIVVKDLWALKLQRLQSKIDPVDDGQDDTQMFSSQAETTEAEQPGQEKAKYPKDFPRLIDTLALCYLAAVLLRLPIMVGDLHRWAVLEELPFLRAIRSIPESMRSKLPVEYALALDPASPLRPNDIHDAVRTQLKALKRDCGMIFPKLNYRPILLKYIEGLALPAETFLPTMELATLLSRTFKFPYYFKRKQPTLLPEIELLSFLVVTVNLFHPFDKLERHVTSVTDLGYLTIDWEYWTSSQNSYMKKRAKDPRVARSKNIDVQEKDIFSMSNSQMDDYLDWFEDTFVEEGNTNANPHHELQGQLEAMFPIGRPEKLSLSQTDIKKLEAEERDAVLQKLRSNQAHLKPRKVIPNAQAIADGEGKSRPVGSCHRRYKHVEDLPVDAKAFFEAAAEMASMSLESLVRAVYSIEVALIRKRRDDKKSGVVSDEDEGPSDDELGDEAESDAEDDMSGPESGS